MRFAILSGMILPPQLLILSLFQILLQFGLYNSLPGLIVAYVATQLAMTVYILEGFFAQLPQDLFDAARMDGYSDFEIFWRITLPIGLPAIFTTVMLNFIILWNEFLYAIVLLTDDDKRTLAARHHAFHGRPSARRRHDRDRADDLHRADHPHLRLLLRHHDQGHDGRCGPLAHRE